MSCLNDPFLLLVYELFNRLEGRVDKNKERNRARNKETRIDKERWRSGFTGKQKDYEY